MKQPSSVPVTPGKSKSSLNGKFGPKARPKAQRKIDAAFLSVMPIYVFTLVFVAGPLIYMFVLSFLKRAEIWGIIHEFTIENYAKILEPIYLKTFWESLKLAGITTLLVTLIGYPFGYFMAKLNAKWKQRVCCF